MKSLVRSYKAIRERLNLAYGQRSLLQILESVDANADLRGRSEWISDLFSWIRLEVNPESKVSQGQKFQEIRVRYLLHVLERQPQLRATISDLFVKTLEESDPLEIFCELGLSGSHGFLKEVLNRTVTKNLPEYRDRTSLKHLFQELFDEPEDADWIEGLEATTIKTFMELIFNGNQVPKKLRDKFGESKKRALEILSSRAAAMALEPDLRARLGNYDLTFEQLRSVVHELPHSEPKLLDTILAARTAIHKIQKTLEASGVSIELVYDLERLRTTLDRIELLTVPIQFDGDYRSTTLFLATLIRNRHESDGLLVFLNSNLSLISKKIVERAGENAETYIARNQKEAKLLFLSSAGGGALTVFTTVIKLAIAKLKLALFIEGLLTWFNYSMSFLVLQFFHLTLATKTPAMTASVLAAKLKSVKDQTSLKGFVSELGHVIKSGVLAILGNVLLVSAGAFILNSIYIKTVGHPLLDEEKSEKILSDHHLFKSLTVWYAVYTGLVLWLGSAIGGWFENWFVYRGLPKSIAENRRLNIVFGAKGAQRVANWVKKNIMGIGTNGALGFLLAFSTTFGRFFGIPLDVRHVTLSSGALSLAISSVSEPRQMLGDIFAAIAGILIIGTLNFFTSLIISILVAAHARDMKIRDYPRLILALLK